MAKLVVQFEDRVLKECVIGSSATIGRLPDNTIVIDNPAVSGHHARVFRDGDVFILEDLRSTNGTYVNEKHVVRQPLQDGDVMLIGKHKIVFDERANGQQVAADPVMATMGDTVYLDTKRHRDLLAKLRAARAEPRPAGAAPDGPAAPALAVPRGVATLRVLNGQDGQAEYKLEAQTSFIGKSREALVRLQGWFAPKVAIAIARSGNGHTATPLGGDPRINNQPLNSRRDLKNGDVIEVGGTILEFTVKE